MSEFTDKTDWYVPISDLEFRTISQLSWEVGMQGSGLWLRVPAGVSFDVSVPKLLRWLVNPRQESYLKGACLHDYALFLGWDRVSAAAAFADALKAEGVSKWRRLAMVMATIVWNWS